MKNVEMYYPQVNPEEKYLRISLESVRAANDIIVSYDYERDGWVISSDLYDPDTGEEPSDILSEVSFIPAWPKSNSSERE